jgi:hypothetical protein
MLLLLLLVVAVPTVQSQTPSPDLPTYERWLRQAHTAAQRNDRLGLEEAAASLIATTNVVMDDGSRVPVDNRWLQQALETSPDPDMPRIAKRLGALLDSLAQPDHPIPPNGEEQLQELLSRPPFTTAPEEESLITKFFDWLIRLLDDLFRPVEQVGSMPANIVGWIVSLLGVVLVVAVLIYFILGLRRTLTSSTNLSPEAAEDERLTAAAAMQQATSLAQAGNYRTAMRYLYLSSLKMLDERGILRYDRALTNREYLERLNHTEAKAHFAPIVETFDRVWYGYAPLDETAFAAYKQQVQALERVKNT